MHKAFFLDSSAGYDCFAVPIIHACWLRHGEALGAPRGGQATFRIGFRYHTECGKVLVPRAAVAAAGRLCKSTGAGRDTVDYATFAIVNPSFWDPTLQGSTATGSLCRGSSKQTTKKRRDCRGEVRRDDDDDDDADF